MPFWPFGRQKSLAVIASPTYELERRANVAFFAKRRAEAERLCREVLEKADSDGRQVARSMLGRICERQQRVDEATAFYEANVREQCPFAFSYRRLAIIYHRLGRPADEARICLTAARVLPAPAQQWYLDRLKKIKH